MLVLSRKVGDSVVISDVVVVKVSQINGGRVKIAIDAPPDVTIRRGEIFFDSPTPDIGGERHPRVA
ncbi:MAG: carbon storage regulator [Planctomycetota bacterium]